MDKDSENIKKIIKNMISASAYLHTLGYDCHCEVINDEVKALEGLIRLIQCASCGGSFPNSDMYDNGDDSWLCDDCEDKRIEEL